MNDDHRHWLVRPQTIRLLWLVFGIILVLLGMRWLLGRFRSQKYESRVSTEELWNRLRWRFHPQKGSRVRERSTVMWLLGLVVPHPLPFYRYALSYARGKRARD